MFSAGMDVALAYRTILAIINDSSLKRTMKIVIVAARWVIVFKVRHIYKRLLLRPVNEDGLSGDP